MDKSHQKVIKKHKIIPKIHEDMDMDKIPDFDLGSMMSSVSEFTCNPSKMDVTDKMSLRGRGNPGNDLAPCLGWVQYGDIAGTPNSPFYLALLHTKFFY